MIGKFLNINTQYMSNTLNPTFPNGMDIEIFKTDIFKRTFKKVFSNYDKEHVTSYIIQKNQNALIRKGQSIMTYMNTT